MKTKRKKEQFPKAAVVQLLINDADHLGAEKFFSGEKSNYAIGTLFAFQGSLTGDQLSRFFSSLSCGLCSGSIEIAVGTFIAAPAVGIIDFSSASLVDEECIASLMEVIPSLIEEDEDLENELTKLVISGLPSEHRDNLENMLKDLDIDLQRQIRVTDGIGSSFFAA